MRKLLEENLLYFERKVTMDLRARRYRSSTVPFAHTESLVHSIARRCPKEPIPTEASFRSMAQKQLVRWIEAR